MYLGRVVEIGPTEEIFAHPRHPYTKALLAAIPEPDPDKAVPRDLPRGEIPDAAQPPLGCAFHPRCPEAITGCGWESRDLRALVEEHWMRADAAYDEEQAVVGDLDHLDEPSTTATVRRAVAAPRCGPSSTGCKAEDPSEPLWSGVTAIEDAGPGRHRPASSRPPLAGPPPRRRGRVACILYPGREPSRPEPGLNRGRRRGA